MERAGKGEPRMNEWVGGGRERRGRVRDEEHHSRDGL